MFLYIYYVGVNTDALTSFYSTSKEKCIEWLTKKREELIHDYKFDYERLLKSKVSEITENIEHDYDYEHDR